jgi:catechol 2,3-dioxygenase-like lactoylglutathione lyase family enzyme
MIAGLNHVGISVADLDRAVAFYRDAFGMELVAQRTFEGEQDAAIMALPGARGRVALLRAANLQIELFEFAQPAPRPQPTTRPVCDHGITHFCVVVADVERDYARLTAAGVRFHCPPVTFARARAKATYGRDPDGNVFELVQYCDMQSGDGTEDEQ